MPTPSTEEGDTRVPESATPHSGAPAGLTPTGTGVSAPTGTGGVRYTIVRHIASGGMGDVYEAHDRELDRRVALKRIKPELVAAPEASARFRREALAAAQLDHPNIVPVYDFGDDAGHPFFTMALIDGESLTARIRAAGPLPPENAVRMLIPVVDAVAYAHHQNLVHRDLKPDNVLIDAHGRLRVTDFGLARHLLEPGNLTGSEQLLGTPKYMAPEQMRAAVGPVGPATDIYALGGVLMFLLTGRTPFHAECLPELLINVLEQPPLLPRDVRTDVPEALNEICRRCLQKKPADRFPSAEALRDALAATLPAESAVTPSRAADPVPAQPRSGKPVVIALAALIVLLLGAVAVVALRDKPRSEEEAKNGDPPKGAPPAPGVPPTDPPTGNPSVPNPGVPVEPPKANPAQVEAPKILADPELFTMTGHNGRVWLSFAPDNRSIVSWGDDMTLRVWDATTGKPVKELLTDKSGTMAVRWAPDGKTVAAALALGEARVWTLPDWGERLIYRDAANGVTAVAFSPDGSKLAVGTNGGALKIFEVKTGKELVECVGHSDRILSTGLYFTPDGSRLVSGSRDDSIRVWTVATGKKELVVADQKDVSSVIPTPNPDRVVVLNTHFGSKYVRFLDLRTGKVEKDFGEFWVEDFVPSPDGKVLWTVGHFGLFVWDLTTMKELGGNKEARATAFAFVPGGKHVLLGGEYHRETGMMVYAVNGYAIDRLRTVQEHRKPIVSVAVSPNGRLAATGDESGVIKVWDVPTLTKPK